MATKRLVDQQEEFVEHPSILTPIEDRPAFQGAPAPEALLTRSQTAEELVKAGFPVSAKTLATKASRGGGPPYSLFGPRPLYRWRDALVWAHGRLTPPRRSSSEGDSARNATNQHRDHNSPLAAQDSVTETRSRTPMVGPKIDELPVLSSGKVRAR
jgi:hypothetical protein